MNRTYLLIGACAVAAATAFFLIRPTEPPTPVEETASTDAPEAGGPLVAIDIPEIEGNALIGQRIFETSCIACHGENAVGIEGSGPPLVHVIYEPSHHADEAFQRAVATGVRSHHWRFGDMPPVGGLTRGDVTMIVSYIRRLQTANGIN